MAIEKLKMQTIDEYKAVFQKCREIYHRKTQDYGTAWRILRPSSLTDQIFIKAQRIRTLEQNGESKVGEGITDEYIGIVNYCIMGLIQLEHEAQAEANTSVDQALAFYDQYAEQATQLMLKKNHDYGEAWRSMRVSSLTDLILQKILRTKQIEDNQGQTIISEGIDANYLDMINYSLFALIRLDFHHES